MTEIEIGRAKRGRRAYSFDDIAIVPSRRTRDPEEVSVAWQIDAYRFELPILAAPMDSVMSPETAIALGQLRRPRRARTSRASGPGTTTPSRCSPRSPSCRARGHPPDAGDLRRADQGRADHRRGSSRCATPA